MTTDNPKGPMLPSETKIFGPSITQTQPSWKAEVIAFVSGSWDGNALRFATKEEAELYVADLMWRWTAVRETRTVPTSDPVTHKWEKGLVPLLQKSDTETKK